jgi:hypothetical protein
MGRTAGTKAVLVRTGYGQNEERRPEGAVTADYVADNLMDAASWILRRLKAHPPSPLDYGGSRAQGRGSDYADIT